jgi:hypothetical protein
MRLADVFKTWRQSAGVIFGELWGGLILNGDLQFNSGGIVNPAVSGAFREEGAAVLVYGPAIATNAALGNLFLITITDNVAFTISSPTNPPAAGQSQRIVYLVSNTSGGAHGAGTWDAAFKALAFPAIATANNRSFAFNWNGANWVQETAAADVAN